MGDDQAKAGSQPLHGAPTPSTSAQASATLAPTSSGTSSTLPDKVTTNPLFGATPQTLPRLASGSSSSRSVPAPPPIPTRTRLPIHHPSPLPSYLRRLTYILSIILGSSAVITGLWSLVVLPLLHASFSARKVLVDQQSDRWTGLVGTLRQIKARGVYASTTPTTSGTTEGTGKGTLVEGSENEKRDGEMEMEMARLTDHEDDAHSEEGTIATEGQSLIPINTISTLSTSLSNLLTAFNSTSTTRTSLLSTVEGYSSYLHRQVYRRTQPFSSSGGGYQSGYSLGTLSANLAKAGGASGSQRKAFDIYGSQEGGEDEEVRLEDMGVKSQEWDAVRKEVRAIKGMLLSRRNFVPQDSDAR